MSCFSLIIAMIYLSVIILYLLLACFFTFKSIKKTGKMSLLLYQPVTYLTMHVSYGWGYLIGIYKILMHKPFNAESNR